MNYIVLDMEWNQPYAPKCVDRAPFPLIGEIIQIGAVMLAETDDGGYEIIDEFKETIAPAYYTKLHSGVKRVTGLSQSDISAEEKEMLADYVADGGKLFVSAGPVEDGILENLYSLLGDYGVTANEGIVVDSDQNHYAFGAPLVLIPDMASSSVTDSLIEENYYTIMPVALGLTNEGYSSKGTVTDLLTTSYMSFSKAAGYDLATYDYEEGDIEGPFSVAVSVEDNSGGKIYWFTSDQFLEAQYNSFSSGSNMDLAMNALSDLIGESEAMAIRSKSLNYNYLTITDATSSLLKLLMIGVFPLAYLGAGICVILSRKKVQNETV